MGSSTLKLSNAIKSIHLLAIDTAPIIYFIERKEPYFSLMKHIIQRIDSGKINAVSSVITLTEVLIQPYRLEKQTLADEYSNLLMNSSYFTLIPIDIKTANLAAKIRAQYNLRTPDAIQVSTAINLDCDAFLSNDLTFKRINDIKILILDELALV
jgi:predicted nucleic acid-binding protein